jgi:crotonobetainyl-CoA:carnitine CoA-transferase CaiB-like acyl-CoA transferase
MLSVYLARSRPSKALVLAKNIEEAAPMLSHCKVLDLTDEKGFLCGKILADLGADVIKIEPPGGDPSRRLSAYWKDDPDPEKSLYWFAYNSNKRGITLNLESADGQAIFKKLVMKADFVIESFPPDYLDKLEIGYSKTSILNKGLIWVSITPFGLHDIPGV